jgi:biopolymer transport protein ExbD
MTKSPKPSPGIATTTPKCYDHIAITADAATTWGTIIRILDAARQAGDDDVGFPVK